LNDDSSALIDLLINLLSQQGDIVLSDADKLALIRYLELIKEQMRKKKPALDAE